MVAFLREADRSPVAELAKQHKISEQAVHTWRKRFEKLEPAGVSPEEFELAGKRGRKRVH